MKYLVFLVGLLVGVPMGTLLGTLSPLICDLVFVALIVGTSLTDVLHLNFVSREWYRGTSQGFEFSFVDFLAWILLLSVLLTRSKRGVRPFWPPGLLAIIVYYMYCMLNVAISTPHLFGEFELVRDARSLVVFLAAAYYLRGEREVKVLLWAAALALAFEGGVALTHRYIYHVWRVSGTLGHPNNLSIYMNALVPVLIVGALASVSMPLRLACSVAAVLGAIGVILSISRTGFATLAIVSALTVFAVIQFRFTARNLAIVGVALLVGVGLAYRGYDTLKSRYSEATVDDYLSEDLGGRGPFWKFAWHMLQDNFFGVGLNNWSYWVTLRYGPEMGFYYQPYISLDEAPDQTVTADLVRVNTVLPQAAPCHALFGLTAGELGWPGLVLFLAVWLRWFWMGGRFVIWRPPRLPAHVACGLFFCLLAVFIHNLTEWGFRGPSVFLLTHALAGGLSSIYYNQYRRIDAR